MNNKIYRIFKKNKKIIIGAIHFPPLFGYKEFPGIKTVLNNALKDLKAFERGGADSVIIENNYDVPHKIKVSPETIKIMGYLGREIKKLTKLPIGVSVLWNDFEAALLIAKSIGAKFIRIPVFVDKVKTDYGIIIGNANKVLELQRKTKTENIALFTDIQVKHAEILNKRAIEESAAEAIKKGSDALIVTGKWTGQAPEIGKLVRIRKNIPEFPLFIGSGADKKNIPALLDYADGAIVSTSLKGGSSKQTERNVKTWRQRISEKKVKEFIKQVEKR